jgi:signal transduction histidine kinase
MNVRTILQWDIPNGHPADVPADAVGSQPDVWTPYSLRQEHQLLTCDGVCLDAEVSINMTIDREILVIIHNVTEYKRVSERLAAQMARIHSLHDLTVELAPLTNLADLLERIVVRAAEVAHSRFASVWLVEPNGQVIRRAAIHPEARAWTRETIQVGEGLVGRVVEQGAALGVGDYQKWPHRVTEQPILFSRAAAVPLLLNNAVIGALLVFDMTTVGEYDPDDIHLLLLLASRAAIEIHRGQLVADLKETNQALQRERELLESRVNEQTAELRAANAELAESSHLKDEFLAGVSHELRTPLSTVLLLIQMLQRQVHGPLNEKQFKVLETLEKSSHHLLSLINDILDMGKFEMGQVDLDDEPVQVSEVCRNSIELVQEMATQKRVALTTEIHPGAGVMQADRRRLQQILTNLLHNAVKFTNSGGQVGLRVYPSSSADAMVFQVWDTGIGIRSADLNRLFRPFVQLDSSLTRRHEGTGLGLALVQRLVHLHNGTIEVVSVEGEGTTFTVALPRQRTVGAAVSGRVTL